MKRRRKELEIYIVSGKSKNRRVKDHFKNKLRKNPKALRMDLKNIYGEINLKAKGNPVAKIKKEMINEPAPQFTMSDLNGNKVFSDRDFKRQNCNCRFLATWCGPCNSSIPRDETSFR
jgi:hypothetical protein